MSFDPLTAILNIGETVINKILPDQESKQKATVELAKMAQEGKFKELEISMSAIIAEAKSSDPWTSRARPSFLYVMYIMILSGIGIGIVSIFSPESATQITTGLKGWLDGIPSGLWAVFGTGYLGYSGMRSFDKSKLMK